MAMLPQFGSIAPWSRGGHRAGERDAATV